MGDTRRALSLIGFGAFKIGRNTGTKYPDGYALPDSGAVERLLNAVLDLGINLIDTAPAYGVSEERIGAAIGHRRDEFFLSSKVGETFENGHSAYDFSAVAVRCSIERSLRRLRTDFLDYVFVHANRDDVGVLDDTEAASALVACRDQGLTRRIGFSGYSAEALRASLGWADAIMVEYHQDDPSLEVVMAEAAAGGVDVIVKKGLASGRLAAAEAVRFVLSNADVTSLVIGGLNIEHIRENYRVAADVRGESP